MQPSPKEKAKNGYSIIAHEMDNKIILCGGKNVLGITTIRAVSLCLRGSSGFLPQSGDMHGVGLTGDNKMAIGESVKVTSLCVNPTTAEQPAQPNAPWKLTQTNLKRKTKVSQY